MLAASFRFLLLTRAEPQLATVVETNAVRLHRIDVLKSDVTIANEQAIIADAHRLSDVEPDLVTRPIQVANKRRQGRRPKKVK